MEVSLSGLAKACLEKERAQLCTVVDESKQKIETAIDAALTILIRDLAKKSSTTIRAPEIFETLDDDDGKVIDNLGGLLAGGNHRFLLQRGAKALEMILGNDEDWVSNSIAKSARIDRSKATTLLRLVTPVLMGVIAKERRSRNLDSKGLSEFLRFSSTDDLENSMPQTTSSAAPRSVAAEVTGEQVQTKFSLLLTLLPLVVLSALIFAGWRMVVTKAKIGADTPLQDSSTIETTAPDDRGANAKAANSLPKVD